MYTIDNANALVSDLLEMADTVADAALEKHTDLAGLGAMFLARASQSTHSAALLATNGLNGDAMSCARTVTEMSIDFASIAKDPDVRIKKFSDYDHVAKFKIAKATDDLHGGTVSREAMRVLQQRHDTSRFNNPESEHNWAGISIRKRAVDRLPGPNRGALRHAVHVQRLDVEPGRAGNALAQRYAGRPTVRTAIGARASRR